jgi:hypothetical protein
MFRLAEECSMSRLAEPTSSQRTDSHRAHRDTEISVAKSKVCALRRPRAARRGLAELWVQLENRLPASMPSRPLRQLNRIIHEPALTAPEICDIANGRDAVATKTRKHEEERRIKHGGGATGLTERRSASTQGLRSRPPHTVTRGRARTALRWSSDSCTNAGGRVAGASRRASKPIDAC